ncbi:MAG: prolyl oligopeptidase family serine peptidase [Propionibacteriaceae bacterium]|nr:prolyl oligopeptidase family serine peptidase [Propionibacteriaceae bacterium]
MKKLRILVTMLVAALTLCTLSATQAEARHRPVRPPAAATFTLNAKVLDGGQQIISLTIDTHRLRIKPSSLSAGTFGVHAKGTNPYTSLDPATVFGTFDVDRTVTGVHLDKRGRIVVDLKYGNAPDGTNVDGASTFAWANSEGRNIMLDLAYTVTQKQPITLRDGRSFTFSALKQGRVSDPEVDAYGSGKAQGMKYRLFKPAARGNRPLIVWLHGGGEGGWSQAYNNDLPLIANRGALGFSTRTAQRIFGGAYVLVPQANDYWLNDAAQGYSARLKKLIDGVVKRNHVDRSRIYVVGASNGGYMTPKLAIDSPGYFAADVPIAPVVSFGGTTVLTDAQLTVLRKTPTWVVQAKNDPVVPFEANGKHIYDVVGNALLSAYDDVTWNGVTYNGHWSWIYVARNDPKNDHGQHIWQWMAKQSLHKHFPKHHHR